MALALSLTTAAAVSYLLIRFSPERMFKMNLGPGQKRTFKGGTLTYPLAFESATGEQRVNVKLVQIPEGVQAMLSETGDHGRSLVVSSKFAGVFSGFSLRLGIGDSLGLYDRWEERRLDLAAEFLPSSLLAKREEITVSAAMLGDRPAGSRGFGQEFYTAELYDPSHDSKGILWKRQARSSEDNLMVRVGEANIPETLTICLIEHQKREPRELPGWMDLASEAISMIGVSVLASGSSLRVIHQVGEVRTASEARDLTGLADLLGWLWRDGPGKERTSLVAEDAAMIVTGKVEIEYPEIFGLLLKKPSVVLSYTSGRVAHGANVAFFTGTENISLLVNRVLSR
jgi:hypothetical protein